MSDRALETLVSGWSLSELAERTGRSVGEIVEFAMSGRRSNSGAKPTSRKRVSAAKVGGGDVVNTRTPAGRDAYRAAVLGVLKDVGGFVGAAEIRSKVGGTPGQARTTLNRLIEQGAASFKGKARATRYKAL